MPGQGDILLWKEWGLGGMGMGLSNMEESCKLG